MKFFQVLVIAAMAIAAVNGQSGANTTPVATSAAAPTAGSTATGSAATATTAPATGATTAASGAVDPTVGAGSAAVDTTVGSSTVRSTPEPPPPLPARLGQRFGLERRSQITMGAACVTVMAVGAYFL
ncbi:hypothetical protein GQ600_353 [Phytophthora cactorum]|nr:hypothetical protein GQ600_353 [Phytophthora cactorum]